MRERMARGDISIIDVCIVSYLLLTISLWSDKGKRLRNTALADDDDPQSPSASRDRLLGRSWWRLNRGKGDFLPPTSPLQAKPNVIGVCHYVEVCIITIFWDELPFGLHSSLAFLNLFGHCHKKVD